MAKGTSLELFPLVERLRGEVRRAISPYTTTVVYLHPRTQKALQSLAVYKALQQRPRTRFATSVQIAEDDLFILRRKVL